MEADYSLSQSYAGLRIANPGSESPDIPSVSRQESAPSPASNPSPPHFREARSSTDPAQSQKRQSFFGNLLHREPAPRDAPQTYNSTPQNLRTESDGSEMYKAPQNDSAARAAANKAYRQSMPLNYQEQQQQAQFLPSRSMQNGRDYLPPGSARPISGVYAAQPPPNAIPSREPSYRIRTEQSRASGIVPSRSDSRAGITMQAGVPSRETSHRDRSYIHNNPPARRSSRGMGSGQVDGLINPAASNEEWQDRGAATGVKEEIDANGKLVLRQVKKGVKDFSFGRLLGEGSYSQVMLATDRQTLKEYAIKILDKKHIIKEKKIKYVNIEKDTLNRLTEHPGIIRLYYTFQDSSSLYYVLDMASGGELLGVLKKIGSFNEECTRFYGAQILDSIEHMHDRGVIHRDLKPENVLLDDQMHIKITDFGTAKLLPDPREPRDPNKPQDYIGDMESNRAKSFVGTAEYVSPELLTDKSACKASDLWAFGCIIYQLLTGRPPFKAANEYLTFQKIVALEYEFPPGFPPAAKDLIERLLVLDPQRRLSIEHIKNHEFFDGVQWGRGLWRMKAPRLGPYIPRSMESGPIKLNGYTGSAPPPTPSTRGPTNSNGQSRPQPRIITELPPPTQLDIEWSPVLTQNNERILKLGNLVVLSTPLPHGAKSGGSPSHEKKGGFARFFSGGNTKKRQRLVMVTSSGRIILAAAGGDEKKTKSELSLLSTECTWKTQIDAKGQETWCVDTRTTHYVFEDIKPSTAGEPSKSPAQEWLESLDRAKDMALSQASGGSYTSEAGFTMGSSVSSQNSTIRGSTVYPEGFNVVDRNGRNHLTKSQASLSEDASMKSQKRHRFSKRQSKNGLSTPF